MKHRKSQGSALMGSIPEFLESRKCWRLHPSGDNSVICVSERGKVLKIYSHSHDFTELFEESKIFHRNQLVETHDSKTVFRAINIYNTTNV